MASIIFETADTPLALGPICTMPERLENSVFTLKISLSTLPKKNMKMQQLPFSKLGQGNHI